MFMQRLQNVLGPATKVKIVAILFRGERMVEIMVIAVKGKVTILTQVPKNFSTKFPLKLNGHYLQTPKLFFLKWKALGFLIYTVWSPLTFKT